MIKNKFVKTGIIFLVSIMILSFSSDLEYKDVLNGKLKMLIPADFMNVPKGSYKQYYESEPLPDDFYCNQDTTEYVAFVKLPGVFGDLGRAKRQLGQMALMDKSNKVHFNDTTTVNGNKIYLLEVDGMSLGKFTATRSFIIKMRDGSAVLGVISCDMKLKKAWWPVSDRMLKSIKLN